MERVAVVGGILLAIFVALGAYVHDHVSVSVDDEEWGGFKRAALVAAAPGQLSETYAAASMRIRNAAAIVRVHPEDRTDIAVTIENPGQTPMPEVTRREGTIVIDGRLSRRIHCRSDGQVRLDGYGVVSPDQLPVITVRSPRDLDLSLGGAVTGEIGAAQSLELSLSGCGDTKAGDVSDRLSISNHGSGDLTAGAARSAEVALAGSGSVKLGAVAESLDAKLTGSGDIEVASVGGELDIAANGSGEVSIRGGAVTSASTSVLGSGSVTIAAPIQTLDTNVVGSGDVIVSREVGDVDVNIVGSGDVVVAAITGSRSENVLGSGDLVVRAPQPAVSP